MEKKNMNEIDDFMEQLIIDKELHKLEKIVSEQRVSINMEELGEK